MLDDTQNIYHLIARRTGFLVIVLIAVFTLANCGGGGSGGGGSDNATNPGEFMFTSGNTFSIAENYLQVARIYITNRETTELTLTLSGGADDALFEINSRRMLSFKIAPNFENSDHSNIYVVNVIADNTISTISQTINITVIDEVDEVFEFISSEIFAIAENRKRVGHLIVSDPNYTYVYMFTRGGADGDLFEIDYSDNTLNFKVAPDFENLTHNNYYEVWVSAENGDLETFQKITIKVRDVAEVFEFTNANTFSILENSTQVDTIVANNLETPAEISFTLADGVDSELFTIDYSNNTLNFKVAPNFEDANHSNTYEVQVNADNTYRSISQTITITVNDVATELNYSMDTKKINFNWNAVATADHYKISEKSILGAGYVPILDNIKSLQASYPLTLHALDWQNVSYIVEECDTNNICTQPWPEIFPADAFIDAIGYVKDEEIDRMTASQNYRINRFGASLAVSGDGSSLFVGSPIKSYANSSKYGVGSVAVYYHNAVTNRWSFGKNMIPPTIRDDEFGSSIATNLDGTVFITGGPKAEYYNSTAANATPFYYDSGQVLYYKKAPNTDPAIWTYKGAFSAFNRSPQALYGTSVSMSDDAMSIAVGAPGGHLKEYYPVTGVVPTGAAYFYVNIDDRTGWHPGPIDGSTAQVNYMVSPYDTATDPIVAGDQFGATVKLSGDGQTLVVAAIKQSVGGAKSGKVFTYQRQKSLSYQYEFMGKNTAIVPVNPAIHKNFGQSLALSSDGQTLAISSTNIDVNTGFEYGAVFIYNRSAPNELGHSNWTVVATLTSPTPDADNEFSDSFGSSLSFNGAGTYLAIGASGEDSAATGVLINPDLVSRQTNDCIVTVESNDKGCDFGAVYTYELDTSQGWQLKTLVKARNTKSNSLAYSSITKTDVTRFGTSVDLSEDGSLLAVGAPDEDNYFFKLDKNLVNSCDRPVMDPRRSCKKSLGAVYLY